MSTENLSPPKRRRKRKKENKPKKEVRNVYLKNNVYLQFYRGISVYIQKLDAFIRSQM